MRNSKPSPRETPLKRHDGIILGLDPGTSITGWGAIRNGVRPAFIECGAIRPPQRDALEFRIERIYAGTLELIDRFRPETVAVEDPFVGKSARSALVLGQARGVILLAAVRKGIEIASYPPRTIKSSVVGSGSATKEQVQFMVRQLLGMKTPPTPIDASDALAVALCHLNRTRTNLIGR